MTEFDLSKVTVEDLANALKLAGVHSADCPQGKRNHHQKYTGMYLDNRKCTCWVGYPTEDD